MKLASLRFCSHFYEKYRGCVCLCFERIISQLIAMHFSIPSTKEVTDSNGSNYTESIEIDHL